MEQQLAEPKRSGSRSERQGSSQAILDAARKLFFASGFDAVNLEMVAEAAGVSRQTIYNQFGSKDAVFRAMMSRHWDVITTEVERAAVEVLDADQPSGVVLRGLAELLLRLAGTDDQVALMRLVIAETRRAAWVGEEFHQIGKQPLVEAIGRTLATLTKAGRLRCDQPEVAARQFIGLLAEFALWPRVVSGEARPSGPELSVMVDETIAMFLARYGLGESR